MTHTACPRPHIAYGTLHTAYHILIAVVLVVGIGVEVEVGPGVGVGVGVQK